MPILTSRDRIETCPYEGNVKFLFWNTGGISQDKYIEIKKVLHDTDIDAFAITEAGAITNEDNLEKAEVLGFNI